MRTVDIHVAQANLSDLLMEISAGNEIVITRDGKAVAKLVPFGTARQKRQLGRLEARGRVPPDFDAPLPDAILDTFEGH